MGSTENTSDATSVESMDIVDMNAPVSGHANCVSKTLQKANG